MLTVDILKEYGADVESGLSRCANNEGLYIRLVGMCLQEISSSDLDAALDAGDLDRAFDAAHKLKGAVSNLALTPIETPVCELTELLRHKTAGDYSSLYNEVVDKAAQLSALCE